MSFWVFLAQQNSKTSLKKTNETGVSKATIGYQSLL